MYLCPKIKYYFRSVQLCTTEHKRLIKTPKIYFYDVGLVCFLLGIKTAQQVETHPLRGQIFENMVVCEFLKQQYNQGQDSNIYFYRDKGTVQTVVKDGGKGIPAKSQW